jgi:hypothetical protein
MAKVHKAPSMSKVVEIKRATLSPEERQRMIAEAAYYRALQRGFADGTPEQDWYLAEAEIENAIARGQGAAK